MGTYQTVERRNGQENVAGYSQRLAFGIIDEFLSIKDFKTSGDPTEINGSHTWTSPNGVHAIMFDNDTLEVKCAPVKDGSPNTSLKCEISGEVSGNIAELRQMAYQLPNEDVIVFLESPTPNVTAMEQYGSEKLPMRASFEWVNGKNGSGEKSMKIKFTGVIARIANYAGTLTFA